MVSFNDVCWFVIVVTSLVSLYYLVVDHGAVPTHGWLPRLTAAALVGSLVVDLLHQHLGLWPKLPGPLAQACAWALLSASFYIQHQSRAVT